MTRLLAMAVLAMLGCSTPRAQLKVELGPRASSSMSCPEDQLQYQELDRVISSTLVKVTGCGKFSIWKMVESRWTRAPDNEPVRKPLF